MTQLSCIGLFAAKASSAAYQLAGLLGARCAEAVADADADGGSSETTRGSGSRQV